MDTTWNTNQGLDSDFGSGETMLPDFHPGQEQTQDTNIQKTMGSSKRVV